MNAVAEADARLVQRCKANDAAAFNEVVARYKDRVYGYVCRMIGPGADAEDLAQETFVRAYTNIHSFQSRATLNTWLFRIATNLCIDHIRRGQAGRGRDASLSMEDPETRQGVERELPDNSHNPEQAALNRELGRRIQEALQDLPPRLRAVVHLFDVEGLSYDEIARVVDCPLGTVKSRLFTARMALRAKLLPYLDGAEAVESEQRIRERIG